MDWIKKEDDRGFRLEAKFLTNRGVERELQSASFERRCDDGDGFKSYIRNWPGGYHAIAHIYPRTRAGRVKVSISYYDSEGTKFRRSPLEGTLSVGNDHQLLVPTQSTSVSAPLSSSAAGLLVHAFAAARAALRKSKYEVRLEHR